MVYGRAPRDLLILLRRREFRFFGVLEAMWKSFPTAAQPAVPRHRTWIGALLAGLAAFLVYVNTLSNRFVFDDLHLIKNNEAIRSFHSLGAIFFDNLWGFLGKATDYYRPIPPLLYMILYHLAGALPWPYHLLNISLHAGTTAVVYLLLVRLLEASGDARGPSSRLAALAGALLFAVHPIHVEAVAWISGMMDVSCAFLCLVSFVLYLRSEEVPRPGKAYAGSLATFFLATLCKEPALVFPLLITVYALLPSGRPVHRSRVFLVRCLPYFGVLAVHLALRAYALREVVRAPAESTLHLARAAAGVAILFARYLGKMLLPIRLNVVYEQDPSPSPVSPEAVLALLLAAGFVVSAVLAAKKPSARPLLTGLVFLALPLLPALSIPILQGKVFTAQADRYLYLPSFGFVLVLAWVLSRVIGERPSGRLAAFVIVLAVLLPLSVMTLRRNRVWKDNLTLWTDAVSKAPWSATSHESLGYALLYAGRPEEGKRELHLALDLDPRIFDKVLADGILYSRKGLTKKAILEFQAALLFRPDSPEAHFDLGRAYEVQGWKEPALEQYGLAVKLKPDFFDAHVNLGAALAEDGRVAEAAAHFRRASELKPGDASVHADLARAFDQLGLAEDAARERRLAERLRRR